MTSGAAYELREFFLRLGLARRPYLRETPRFRPARELEMAKWKKNRMTEVRVNYAYYGYTCYLRILIKRLTKQRIYFWYVALEGSHGRGNYLFSWLDSDRIRAYSRMCIHTSRLPIGVAVNTGRFDAKFVRGELMTVWMVETAVIVYD